MNFLKTTCKPGGVYGNQYGVELELEYDDHPFLGMDYDEEKSVAVGYETVTAIKDGSLRGGLEWLLPPNTPDKILNTLSLLKDKPEFLYDDVKHSVRTSTHVHMNCNRLTYENIYSICFLYMILEPLLYNFLPTKRQNNTFCNSLTDTKYMLFTLVSLLKQNSPSNVGEDLKYSSINYLTILSLGTLEFRILPSEYCLDNDVMDSFFRFLTFIRGTSKQGINLFEFVEKLIDNDVKRTLMMFLGRKLYQRFDVDNLDVRDYKVYLEHFLYPTHVFEEAKSDPYINKTKKETQWDAHMEKLLTEISQHQSNHV